MDYETFDLVDAFTVHINAQGSLPSTHYLVDNCGGDPLRLARTFDYRPGAARVGGAIVLCSGGLGGLEGIWELLEDGTAGADLGLGRWCADRLESASREVGLSALGVVAQEGSFTQYLPDGTKWSIPGRTFHQLGDAFVVEGDDIFTLLPPDGADPIALELPERIVGVLASPGASRWALLLPEGEARETWLYALDAGTGAWFRTEQLWRDAIFSQQVASVRDGLAAVAAHHGSLALSRPQWSEPLATDPRDFGSLVGLTVVDGEHVYLRNREDLIFIRVAMTYPTGDELGIEVLWTRNIGQQERPPDGAGIPWNDVVLDATNGELWAYPVDGSDQYPFLPGDEHGLMHFGSDSVTALGKRDRAETLELFRNSVGGAFEVLDTGILDFQDRPWTPEFGRIVYAVRDGDEVSVRQHVLMD